MDWIQLVGPNAAVELFGVLVVEQHDAAVFRQIDVDLDGIGPLFEAEPDARLRVLGGVIARPAMGDDLNGVAAALRLSRRTTGVIRQNIAFSLATKLLALVLAAFGIVNLWIAVAADMGTSLAVTLNGMRLALPGPLSGAHSERSANTLQRHVGDEAPALTRSP